MKSMRVSHKVFRQKVVIEHNGERISLKGLSRLSGIAYSTLQGRYEKGLRGEQLLGPRDPLRIPKRGKRVLIEEPEPPRSEISGLLRQFLVGLSTVSRDAGSI